MVVVGFYCLLIINTITSTKEIIIYDVLNIKLFICFIFLDFLRKKLYIKIINSVNVIKLSITNEIK